MLRQGEWDRDKVKTAFDRQKLSRAGGPPEPTEERQGPEGKVYGLYQPTGCKIVK